MSYKKFGLKWFFKVVVQHQLYVTIDRNAAYTHQLFILQDHRYR
jgi:hypothetical protein